MPKEPKKRKTEVLNTPLSATDLEYLHDQGIQYFTEKWESGVENERFQKGKHWDESQEQKIRSQDRQPYSMAAMATKLNIIKSTQKQARTQFRVESRVDPNDEYKAIFGTLALRDVERNSNFKFLESEVFDSGLAIKYGAAEAYVDYSKLEPRILLKKLSYRDVVWDINSIDFDPWEDGLFIAKREAMYRYQLANEYGDIVNEIAENEGNFGRPSESYYISKNPDGKAEFDILYKFTHYQKVIRTYYHVIFPDTMKLLGLENQIVGKYKDKKEAEKKLRELNAVYLANGLDMEGSIEDKDEEAVDKYVFADSRILEYEETDLPSAPIKIFKCFHFEDDFWSFMDMLKSPQMFMDRLFSQIDYTFGTDIKNVYQLNVNALAENETPESASRKAQQTGGVIRTNSNEEILRAVQSKGINPQWMEVATIMQQFIEDFAGGRSFQGLSEGSGESGKAINLKKQQGTLVAALMLDNLTRWKKALGEIALYLIQTYDTFERQIKVQGAELTPEMIQALGQYYTPSQISPDSGYVTMNKGIPFLKDADFELTITEAALTETERDAKFFGMIEAASRLPYLQQSPTFIMKLIEYNPEFSPQDRRQIVQEIQGRLQQEAETAKREQDIKAAQVLQDGLTSQLQSQTAILSQNRKNNENQRARPS